MTTCVSFSDLTESQFIIEAALDEIKAHVDVDSLPMSEEDYYDERKCNSSTDREREFISYSIDNPAYSSSLATPSREEYSGQYNFEILFNVPGRGKSSVYSSLLRKIYIDIEQRLSLRFKWEPPLEGFWLRAMLVFCEDRHRRDPVLRCHNHLATSSLSNQNVQSHVLRYVLRCESPNTFYEEYNGHLSLLIPLGAPEPGCTYVPLDFQFYCKNSCSSGMNRRATELVFMLETENRVVVGRRFLPVRVCSCPKRDKAKEELESQEIQVPGAKKRKITRIRNLPPPPLGKKHIITPNNNEAEYSVQLRVPGFQNMKNVLKNAYNTLAGEALRSGDYQRFHPYLEEIQKKMNNLQ